MYKISAGENHLSLVAQTSKSPASALVRLMRPPNVITAHADILAGYAASGFVDPVRLGVLLLATTGLYGGGIVLNDVFDAKLDAVERPERPIPSGAVSLQTAASFGALLLLAGILAAYACSPLSGAVALATAASAVLYDSVGKHHPFLGPFNMGFCRGLNLLLGLTVGASVPLHLLPLALITLCYIAGITSLSRGEVRGGTQTAAAISATWLALALIALVILLTQQGINALFATPFFALLLLRIVPPFRRAFQTLQPAKIGAAVKVGVLSLIVLDAGLAALCGGPWYGLGVLLLYLPAMALAKLFAVT